MYNDMSLTAGQISCLQIPVPFYFQTHSHGEKSRYIFASGTGSSIVMMLVALLAKSRTECLEGWIHLVHKENVNYATNAIYIEYVHESTLVMAVAASSIDFICTISKQFDSWGWNLRSFSFQSFSLLPRVHRSFVMHMGSGPVAQSPFFNGSKEVEMLACEKQSNLHVRDIVKTSPCQVPPCLETQRLCLPLLGDLEVWWSPSGILEIIGSRQFVLLTSSSESIRLCHQYDKYAHYANVH